MPDSAACSPLSSMLIGIDVRPLLDDKPTGVSDVLTNLLSSFAAFPHHEFVLFANSRGRTPKLPPLPQERFRLEQFRIPNTLLNASLAMVGEPRIDALLERRGARPDVMLLPNINFWNVTPRVPYALIVHDLSFAVASDFFRPKDRLWHRAVRPRRLIERAAAVIAVSEHTKQDLIQLYGIPAERITVAHPATGPEFAERPAPARLAEIKMRHRLPDRFLLFLGTLEERKNIRGLLRAFELSEPEKHDLHLILAGKLGHGARSFLRALAKSPVKNRVRILGFVPAEDRPALYALARCFLYPSFYEGFGLPALEAMSMGTPVIAANATSLPEVIGNAGLLINPYNPQEIADAISAILSDPYLAHKLSESRAVRARMFSWARSARRVLETLESLTNKNPRSM